jgi:hypothetical protein
MSSTSKTPIQYLFIGDLYQKNIIAQESVTNMPSAEKDSKQIFDRWCMLKKHKYSEHSKVSNKYGNYYFTSLQPDKFYLVLVESNYNESDVFDLINEIHDSNILETPDDNGRITEEGRVILRAMIEKYQQKKQTNIMGDISHDINDIKLNMSGNIRNLIANQENVNELQVQSEQINNNSNLFRKGAEEAKSITCRQNVKLWIIIGLIAVAILIVIIVPIAIKNSGKKETTNKEIIILQNSNSTDTEYLNKMDKDLQEIKDIIKKGQSDTEKEDSNIRRY